VQSLPKFADPNLIVGADSFNDTGVYRLRDDLLIMQSLDFFPPPVDDHFLFGQIAAANSMSDIFAMGARLTTALNIVGSRWLELHFGGGYRLDKSWPYWGSFGSWEALTEFVHKASMTVGILSYRKDGWVALEPQEDKGVLLTKVLRGGRRLGINARTRHEGFVRVEVLDASGNELKDYCGKAAAVFQGDAVGEKLNWNGGRVEQLPDERIRVRITVKHGELFALIW